jgi:hypothetical protein
MSQVGSKTYNLPSSLETQQRHRRELGEVDMIRIERRIPIINDTALDDGGSDNDADRL